MPEPPDLTNQYNTTLTPEQEQAYQLWIQQQSQLAGRDMSRDLADYDMRGAFISGVGQAGNMHWPDTFKKPSHPTFSTESKYSSKDMTGGVWTQNPGGGWLFAPGKTNLEYHGIQGIQDYLQRSDPSVRLQGAGDASKALYNNYP